MSMFFTQRRRYLIDFYVFENNATLIFTTIRRYKGYINLIIDFAIFGYIRSAFLIRHVPTSMQKLYDSIPMSIFKVLMISRKPVLHIAMSVAISKNFCLWKIPQISRKTFLPAYKIQKVQIIEAKKNKSRFSKKGTVIHPFKGAISSK